MLLVDYCVCVKGHSILEVIILLKNPGLLFFGCHNGKEESETRHTDGETLVKQ